MIIKLLKPWNMSNAGEILNDVAPPIADILIKRKIAKVVRPRKKKVKK